MKKRLPLAAVTLITVLLVWSMVPLKSRDWDIEFDPDLQEGKEAYLQAVAKSPYPAERPNIVLIVADDLGLTDISLYGSEHLETPFIDSIGQEGNTYTEAYASAPICSPSRAGMLTGRYQNRFGFDSQPMTRYARTDLEWFFFNYFVKTDPMHPIKNDSIPYPDQMELQGMPPTEVMLSEALGASGYNTSIIGKWHLGYGELQHPNNRGFDSYYGFLEAFSYFIDPGQPGVESWQFSEFSEKHIWRQERKNYCAIQRDGVIIDETEHLTDAFAREAVSYIDGVSKNEPFFLYLPFSAPHTPFQALETYTERFSHVEDPRKRIYYAMIAQLDDAVGEILTALKMNDLDENTIVIFTSDNGGATYTGATGNDPLRGGKMSHFEGGLAVPLMIRWPKSIEAGGEEDTPVIHLDLFSTLMSAAGLPTLSDRITDGEDLLSENGVTANRPLFWKADYNRIIRYGKWKLMINGKDGSRRLYNMEVDREENRNLINTNADMAQKLEEMLDEWDAKMAPPAWPRVMDYYYNEEGEEYWFAT